MNRLRTWGALLLAFLAWDLCRAADTPPPVAGPVVTAPAPTNPPAATPPVAAPSEADTAALRDPFWPTGWRPPNFEKDETNGEPARGQVRWDEALGHLHIIGLSKKPDGAYLAILQGAGIVEKGDVITVRYDSLVYKWRVADITSEGIVPERMDASNDR